MRSSKYDSPRPGPKPPHPTSPFAFPPRRQEDVFKSRSPDQRSEPSPHFVEDRRGDRQNLAYGSLDRRSIPRYHTAGNGALIGLPSRYRITSRSETRREVENVDLDSVRRSRKQSLLSNVFNDDMKSKKLLSREEGDEEDPHKDFLRFEHRHPNKRRRIDADADRHDSQEDDSYGSSSGAENERLAENAFDAFKKDPVHQHHLKLANATSERPHDVQIWQALIDYQQTSFHHDSHDFRPSSVRSLAELKISLYEQALSHINDREGRQTLILGMMQEGNKIWNAEEQASRWQSFLDNDSSFDLWILYLNFAQSHAVKFSFEECLNVYKRCLRIFRDSPARSRDAQCVYLLLRATLFLWQCGFTEHSIGIWQALLEYNFFRPANLTSEELLSSFGQFWGSEVSRIGEEGATGWGSEMSPDLEPKADEVRSPIHGLDFDTWASAESNLEKHAGMPARSLDDVNEDDPYRIVLFSDIKDFLFTPLTDHGLRMLQDAFLLFLGLPRVSHLPETEHWTRDPFVYSHSPATAEPALFLGTPKDGGGLSEDFRHDIPVFQEVRFLPPGVLSPSRKPAGFHSHFARRVFSQLAAIKLQNQPDELMMEYVVAFEADIDPKSARKLAKSFLKCKSDSLRLYNAYAKLECQLGNFEAAERVWSTALSMRSSLNQDAESRTFSLFRDWAYSYMFRKKYRQAKVLLTMVTDTQIDLNKLQKEDAESSKPSVATQIRVEQYIQSQFDNLVSRGRFDVLPELIDVLAIHKYLNDNLRLESTLQTYDNFLKLLTGPPATVSPAVERVHVQRASLLHAHSTTFGRDFRPREICAILMESVARFPENFYLQLLCHYYTQKSGLIDRLRQVESKARVHDWTKDARGSIIPCILDLLVELKRPSYSGSTNHSIRSAFKRTTEQGSPGHHSVEIWKAYVSWELSNTVDDDRIRHSTESKDQKRERERKKSAAESFYASLRACPWAKELYMLAFGQRVLRDVIGDDGLKQVYQSMVERGLRLHIDISDSLPDSK
ncbi:uncharacterized protein Z518_02679 [Rhinocladiella mackenziei CBS 650.93]|uniref:DUF1740-domain-containing protein n=1 Tax=Rhinocladiella mackenziei CBS 650.93 TaxID=1442369 RepID=A0A0D2IQ75_9EURO|nr:uncharacterized protein Z518_02679 [Rhinocladiella mackenziei CBS 650.93]KIX08024.1 hypothetical protein Z518_02679 [Rhinocladiella mackenziei CBS 650.93]